MIRPSINIKELYLYRDYVDFRKSINGLSTIVESTMSLDPFSGKLFVFCSRSRDKIKIIYWERNGFCLWYKRLEEEKFKWPKKSEDSNIFITGQQLNWLLDGIDISKIKPHKKLHYESVF